MVTKHPLGNINIRDPGLGWWENLKFLKIIQNISEPWHKLLEALKAETHLDTGKELARNWHGPYAT